jgi:hypothetical protein
MAESPPKLLVSLAMMREPTQVTVYHDAKHIDRLVFLQKYNARSDH